MNDTGQRIRELREAAEMTQTELAGRAGSTQDHISDLERGVHLAGQDLLGRLADALHCSPGELLTE